MDLERAIKYALVGDAILFLGSGASVGAVNQNNESFPIGKELSERLYPGCVNLDQAAEFFCEDKEAENKDGKQELITFLKKQFRASKITDHQKLLPSVPWKRIYTTNYDNVVEKAYTESGQYIRNLTIDDKANKYLSSDETIYLHINGSVEKLNKDTLNNQFKLTDSSYNTSAFNSNEWGKLFASDLSTYSVVIFIGFTMNYDLDIKRIISTINKDKCIFITSENEDHNTVRMLQKYGNVERIGFNGFFDKISNVKLDFDYEDSCGLISLSNFERISSSPALNEPNDSDVLKYYKVGKKTNELYFKDGDGYKAIVKRNDVDKIINEIESGIEAIFIHSDIGNGKTEMIDQICYNLSSQYIIYKLKNNNEKIAKEIERICETSDKKIVIIENFFNYYDVFEQFKLFNSNKNITFILTARTSIYKSRYEQFSFNKVAVYDLNRLNSNEINKLVKIFNEYGYYPKESVGDNYNTYIKKRYDSKVQSVILGIFENEIIINSLQSILKDIMSLEKNSQNVLLFMIISKVMNLELNFSEMLDLLTIKSVDYSFEKNNSINELVNFNGIDTSIKSVTVCTWILKNLKNSLKIIDILVECATQADIGYKVNKKYEEFLRNIISYRHLKFILNLLNSDSTDKLKLINLFYQRIKNLSYYKDKYFFWLQYGISALELNDLEGAEHHFNAALTKIKSDNIPFEINNQYARLKMEIMLTPTYKYNSSTYAEFVEINRLLTPTAAKEDDEYYCYKMSSSYYPKVFAKFYSHMIETEQNGLKEIANSNYNLCIKYMVKNRNESFVKKVSEFASIFEGLSKYEEDRINFYVKLITRNFAVGEIKINDNLEHARIHISQLSKDYVSKIEDCLSVGETVKVKILKYNDRKNIWELTRK